MSTLLSKANIIAADDLSTRDIEVPEWGGTVRIRAATPAVIKAVRAAANNKKNEEDDSFGYRLMAKSMIDENGDLMFDLKEIPDLEKKSLGAIKRVMDEINDLNGFIKKPGEVGNDSGATQNAGSTSD